MHNDGFVSESNQLNLFWLDIYYNCAWQVSMIWLVSILHKTFLKPQTSFIGAEMHYCVVSGVEKGTLHLTNEAHLTQRVSRYAN